MLFLHALNDTVHQSRRRNTGPDLGAVIPWVVVPPIIVFFLADFTGAVFFHHRSPGTNHLIDLRCVLSFSWINMEKHLSLSGFDRQSVTVFQCKKSMHKAEITVDIRCVQCQRRYTQRISQGLCQIFFGCSGSCLILRHTDISCFLRQSCHNPKILLGHSAQVSNESDASACLPYQHRYPFMGISGATAGCSVPLSGR